MYRDGKKFRRRILVTTSLVLLWTLLVIAVVFAKAFWFAHPSVVRGDFASIEHHLVQELSDAANNKRVGSAALALLHNGKIAAAHGFGIANADTQAPVETHQTLYRVASVSKAVTAWGVMKLVQDGRLSLDEPVMRHLTRWRFPGSEEYRDKVTVRHLLAHTAGLDDGLGYGGFLPGEHVQSLEESLTLPKDSTVGEPRAIRVVREPGTAMAYSGAGYTVLQLLIEEVTKRPFADYIKDSVLTPLGMTRSSFDLDAITSEGRVQEIATSYDHELRQQPHRRQTAKAAASLYTTAHDLARFAMAYTARENPVLTQETVKQMLMPQPGTAGTWGLGQTLFVANEHSGHIVGHDGGSPPAWGGWVRVNPATGNGIVMMISGGSGAVNKLADDWIYWETGQVTFESRRQTAFQLAGPALVAIIVGAVVITLWQIVKFSKLKAVTFNR
jgi:CubicO group peptidase (beta-lactamase class C family)